MKPEIVAAIERVAGDRLTPEMREQIADETIRIMEAINRAAALSAIETAKEIVIKKAEASSNAGGLPDNDVLKGG